MYCGKCGNRLEENDSFCGKCGNSINEKNKFNFSVFSNKKVLSILGIIIVVLIGWFIKSNIDKSNLSKELLRDWSREETGESGSNYTLELDFSENKIKYNFKSSVAWLNSTLATYNYEVISGNKIKIKNKEYTIEFNSTKTKMTMTPALTKIADHEIWYNTD